MSAANGYMICCTAHCLTWYLINTWNSLHLLSISWEMARDPAALLLLRGLEGLVSDWCRLQQLWWMRLISQLLLLLRFLWVCGPEEKLSSTHFKAISKKLTSRKYKTNHSTSYLLNYGMELSLPGGLKLAALPVAALQRRKMKRWPSVTTSCNEHWLHAH